MGPIRCLVGRHRNQRGIHEEWDEGRRVIGMPPLFLRNGQSG